MDRVYSLSLIHILLFVSARTKKGLIWYYISVAIAIAGGITGISDNFYIAMAVVFGFLPFYAFNSKKGIKRYVVLLATTLTIDVYKRQAEQIKILSRCMDYKSKISPSSGTYKLPW